MSYRSHFALERYPFETIGPADELFALQAGEEANAPLDHLLELRGIGLLTGAAGCGKTTACRHFAAGLSPGQYKVGYVSLSTGTAFDTYRLISWELGLEPHHTRAGCYRLIRDEVSRLACEARRQPFLILDEAHHLRHDVLEELRLLTSYAMDAEQRLCLLLVGLPELERRLALGIHESLDQRIVMRHRFGGLGREELAPYLLHRLRRAGCQLELFLPAAVEALFLASRGMPRRVDRLAHYALLAAAAAEARHVGAEHVEQALPEARTRAPRSPHDA